MLLGTVVTDASILASSPMQRDCGPVQPASRPVQPGRWGSWGSTPAVVCRLGYRPLARSPNGSGPSWDGGSTGATMPHGMPTGWPRSCGGRREPGRLPFTEARAVRRRPARSIRWWYVPRRQGRFIRRNLLVAPAIPGSRGEVCCRGSYPPRLLDDPRSCLLGDGPRIRRTALTSGSPEFRDGARGP